MHKWIVKRRELGSRREAGELQSASFSSKEMSLKISLTIIMQSKIKMMGKMRQDHSNHSGSPVIPSVLSGR